MELLKNETDFFTSLEKAFDEIDPKWRDYPGLVILGSHTPTDVEKKIAALTSYRKSGVPVLGICFGMQLMVVEYMREEMGVVGATTQEIDTDSPSAVIVSMGKMRVGMKYVSWWGGEGLESHWHSYKVADDVADALEVPFNVYKSDDEVVEAIILKKAQFYAGTQFHPEYQSSKGRPHPILKEFLEACKAAAAQPQV